RSPQEQPPRARQGDRAGPAHARPRARADRVEGGGVIAEKQLHRWMGGYVKHLVGRLAAPAPANGPRHLLFAFCDHYEPLWKDASKQQGDARVDYWVDNYPRMANGFRDA